MEAEYGIENIITQRPDVGWGVLYRHYNLNKGEIIIRTWNIVMGEIAWTFNDCNLNYLRNNNFEICENFSDFCDCSYCGIPLF